MTILSYHSVSPKFTWGITRVTPNQFSSQIKLAFELGFSFTRLNDLLNVSQPFQKKLVFTFDDGFENIYHHAFPLLQEYQLTATVFVVAGFCGQYNTWDVNWGMQRLCHMDWVQVKELAAAGWTIGSHGLSHQSLSHLSQKELNKEIYSSKALIEKKIQMPCHWLSLPFGNGDQRVLDTAYKAGYRGVVGMSKIPSHATLICHTRTGIYLLDNSFTFSQKCIAKYKKIFHLMQGALDICSNGTVWVKQGIGIQSPKEHR